MQVEHTYCLACGDDSRRRQWHVGSWRGVCKCVQRISMIASKDRFVPGGVLDSMAVFNFYFVQNYGSVQFCFFSVRFFLNWLLLLLEFSRQIMMVLK